MRKAMTMTKKGIRLGKRPFPIKRFIFGCIAAAIGIVVGIFIIKNAGAGLSEITIPVGADTQNSIMTRPEDGTPADLAPIDNLFIAAGVLKEAGSFSAECKGTSTSMGVSQGIRSSRTVIGQKAFKEVVSYSSFVKMGEQRYFNGSDYLIRGSESVGALDSVSWGGTVTPVDKETYLARYGYIPCEMTSYILNAESIEKGELVSAENDTYTFHYDLNIQLAPVNLLYEMRTSAGTSNYPKFLNADMTVVMDGDWTVKSVSTSAKYEVAMLGGVTCEESMTETFTQIGGITQLPETEFFAPYFGAETTDDVEKAPDALTAITSVFGDYINGKPLNAKLVLSAPGTEFDGKSALLRLGLDIENTDNITVDARIGGLDFSYKNKALYLAYGDFRGSMTVDGLTSAVGSVCSLLGVDAGALLPAVDLDSLLGGLTMTETDDGCVISLDADLGGLSVSASINALKDGEAYALTSIVIKIGDITLTAQPCEAWEVTEFDPATCPDLLGLLDILGDGTVAFNADINGFGIDLQYDIKNNVLNAFAGDITLALQDNTLYVQYNEIKLKLKLSDIPNVIDDLKPILSAFGLDLDLSSLGSIGNIDINGILNTLDIVSDGTNAKISVELFGIKLSVDLAAIDNRWTLTGIDGAYGEIAVTAKPCEARPFVTIDDGEYVNAKVLTKLFETIVSQPLNFELALSAPNTPFDGITALVRVDLDIENLANTTVDARIGSLDFSYRNGMLFLSYGDFKGSVAVDGISVAIDKICNIFGVSLEMPSVNIDIASLLGGLELTQTTDGCKLSLTADFGITAINASLTIANGALSTVNVNLGEMALTANACDAWEVTEFDPVTCPDLLGLLDVLGDGTVAFTADINGFGIDLQYDIKNNVLNAFAGDITLALQDETLYVQYNEIKLKLKLSDLPNVIDDLKPILTAIGLDLDLSSLGELGNININGILDTLDITSDGTNATISVELFGIKLSVDLAAIDNRWTLAGINGSYGEIAITAKPCEARPFVTIDDEEYVNATVLTELLKTIVSQPLNFKLALSAPNTPFDGMTALICLDLDFANLANTTVDARIGSLDFSYRNGMLFLSYGDFKGSVAVDGISAAIDKICNIFGVTLEMPSINIDVASLLSGLELTQTTDGCKLSLTADLGTTAINASLTIANGALSTINVNLGEMALTANACEAWEVTEFDPVTCPDLLGLLDVLGDGTVAFTADINGFGIDLQYDIKNNVLNVFAGDITLALQDNTIYVQYNEIKLKLKLSDLPNVIDDIKPILSALGLNLDLSSLGSIGNIDINGILNTLDIVSDGTNAKISVELFGINLSVDLTAIDNRWTLAGINGAYGEIAVTAKPCEARPFVTIDDGEYVNATVITGLVESIVSQPLNFELALSAPNTPFDGMTALVRVDLDIENLTNTTVDARVGSLDFSYRNGMLFLSYGDFKGSVAVDSISAAIDKICNIFGVSLDMPSANIDINSLLSGLELIQTTDGCKLSLTADFGITAIDASLTIANGTLSMIDVNLGDIAVTANACEAWEVTEFDPATCPDLLGLLDVLGDGTVAFTADINGFGVDLQYDIKNNVLNAFAGDITLALQDETLYVQYNEIKLKLKLSDIPNVIDDLKPILTALGLDLDLSSLGELGNIDINGILDTLDIVSDGTNATISVELFGIKLSVDLAAIDNRWTLAGINGAYGEIAVTAKLCEARPFVMVDDAEYVNATVLTELLKTVVTQPLNFELALSAPNTPFDGMTALVRVDLDIENLANTTVDARIGSLDFSYRNGMLFLSYGDFKGSVAVDGISAAIDKICNIFGVSLEMPSVDIDVNTLLGGLELTQTTDGCKLSLTADLGITTIDASLTIANGALSTVNINLGDIALTANACNAWEVTQFDPATCPDLLGLLDILGDGTVAFTADINGFGIDLQYDIKNNVLNAFAGDITLALQDNTIYVQYNEIKLKLKLSDLPNVIDDLEPILSALGLNLDLSSLGSIGNIDINAILNTLDITSDGTNAKISAELFGIKLSVDLTAIDNRWTLTGINGAYGEIAVTAKPCAPKSFIAINDNEFIDCASVLHTFAAPIADLIAADAFAFDVALTIGTGSSVYGVQAAINLNGGIAATGTVSVNGMNAIAFDVKVVGGIAYVSVNGIDLAFKADGLGGGTTDIAALLGSLRGYNGTLDAVIDDLLGVIAAANGGIDFGSLLKSLSFDETAGVLTATVGGGQFGLADLAVALGADNGLRIGVADFVFGGVAFDAGLRVRASSAKVVAPDRAYVTDLAIRIDELNTLYLRLDTLNGVYRFRLDDLYGEYAGDTFRINYRDVYLRGNINELGAIIASLDAIVKDAQMRYAAGLIAETALAAQPGGDFLKDLLNSLIVSVGEDGNSLKFAFRIFGVPADLTVACGDSPAMTVNIGLLGKDVTASVAGEEIRYFDFGGVADNAYVDITEVFKDYLGELETLVSANSWRFELSAEIEYNGVKYLLAEGSAIDLVYYTADKFDLKATLQLKKWDGAGYADAYNIVAAYVDGRIYIDYANAANNADVKTDNHLKLTLSAEAIAKCADLAPRLLEVVPQIAQLIEDMKQAQSDALHNLELVKYSSIIKAASYENGALGIVIDAGVILPALGDLDLTIMRGANGGLRLSIGSFTYNDNAGTSLSLSNVAVSVVAQSEETGNANIGAFTTEGYIDLDSIYELLSAFTNTADNNAFKLSGTAKVSLAGIVSVDIGLDLVVDIDADGYVYVSFRLYREKLGKLDLANAAFVDYGGYSYLNYNGKTNTMRVIRNSYEKYTWCSKCGRYDDCSSNFWHLAWHSDKILLNTERGFSPEYDSGEISASAFGENMIDYILQMVNFKGWINDQITGAMNGEGSGAVYGIEDIIKSYAYTDGNFGVTVDLSPIDGNLGELSLNIYHDENLCLSKLTASMNLLGSLCTINVNGLDLLPPESGLAISRVEGNLIW